jgi:hypothetical protein
VFTSGIVSTGQGWRIALYFTGREHAGENIADVLKRRATELSAPIQMGDALSRNVPKLAAGVEILLTAWPMEEGSSWRLRRTSPATPAGRDGSLEMPVKWLVRKPSPVTFLARH